MTAKSLVLHIGDPKTGTSSIQHVLLNRLYDSEITVDYPDQLNAFPLANALSDPKQAAFRTPRWGRLAAWLHASQADVAIVSAEQFFRVKPAVLQAALDEFLPDHARSIRIVAYVRPHTKRLLSAYMQRTKAGLYQGDLQGFFDRSKRENLLHYAPRFAQWRGTFGDRFTLRPMIRTQLKDGDVVADFIGLALQGAAFTLHGTVDANPSVPLEYLTGLREVQAVLKRNAVATGTRQSVGDRINHSLATLGPGTGTALRLPQALYAQVHAYCAEDAAALDAAFFDSPLMTDALNSAAADALAIGQPLLAQHHYSGQTLVQLRKQARQLATLFKKRPTAWTVAYEHEIGQRPANDKPVPPPVRAHVAKVNLVLDGIAQTLLTPAMGPTA